MKLFLSLGLLGFALSFCNLGDKLKSLSGSNSNSNSNSQANNPAKTPEPPVVADKPIFSEVQQKIVDSSTEVKWDDRGISWRLPAGWKKTEMTRGSVQFSSPDGAFLIPMISILPGDFPSDMSLKGTHDSAMLSLHSDKFELVRYLEIDGIKGVESRETMPGDKSGPRRHQWIGFRKYQGQTQQLNIMLSTKGSNFDKHRDEFLAIMYSMKIEK